MDNTNNQQETDVFEAIYEKYASGEESNEVKDQTTSEGDSQAPEAGQPEVEGDNSTKDVADVKEESKQDSAEGQPGGGGQETKQEPTGPPQFEFNPNQYYPVPGRSGQTEWVPFKAFKRYIEKGRNYTQLMEKMKAQETELAAPRVIADSIKDIPEEHKDKLFQEIQAIVNKVRQEAKLAPVTTPMPKKESELPPKYKALLDEFAVRQEQEKRQRHEADVLRKVDQAIKDVTDFAKKEYDVDIDDAMGDKIIEKAKEIAAANEVPLYKVDLISVFARLNQGRMKAKKLNDAGLEGRVKKPKVPVVAPKTGTMPKEGKKKYDELSDDERSAMDPDERSKALDEHLMKFFGR